MAVCAAGVLFAPHASFAQEIELDRDGRWHKKLRVKRLHNLEFAAVMAGVPRRVDPLDPTAALFEIRGPRRAWVRLSVLLPERLRHGSDRLDISFDDQSAAWSGSEHDESVEYFDPRRSLSIRLPRSGRAYVWVGGTVLPEAAQAAGGPYIGQLRLRAGQR